VKDASGRVGPTANQCGESQEMAQSEGGRRAWHFVCVVVCCLFMFILSMLKCPLGAHSYRGNEKGYTHLKVTFVCVDCNVFVCVGRI
jgi:hypothetical protein